MRINYETKPCSRCGGCGEYSYCQRHGTTCFGCGGKGKQLTRNGRRAQRAVTEFMRERYSKPVEALEVGDQIREGGTWRAVTTAPEQSRSSFLDKATGRYVPFIEVRCKGAVYAKRPGDLVQVRPTAEQFRDEVIPCAKRHSGARVHECSEAA